MLTIDNRERATLDAYVRFQQADPAYIQGQHPASWFPVPSDYKGQFAVSVEAACRMV